MNPILFSLRICVHAQSFRICPGEVLETLKRLYLVRHPTNPKTSLLWQTLIYGLELQWSPKKNLTIGSMVAWYTSSPTDPMCSHQHFQLSSFPTPRYHVVIHPVVNLQTQDISARFHHGLVDKNNKISKNGGISRLAGLSQDLYKKGHPGPL